LQIFLKLIKYRIRITQFTYLNKLSIFQFSLTDVGTFLLDNWQNTQVIRNWGVRN